MSWSGFGKIGKTPLPGIGRVSWRLSSNNKSWFLFVLGPAACMAWTFVAYHGLSDGLAYNDDLVERHNTICVSYDRF